jgi:DNA-binding response OmpR family regulator
VAAHRNCRGLGARDGTGEDAVVSSLLLLSDSLEPSTQVLPALALLPHHVRVLPAEATVLIDTPACDALLVDGRSSLATIRSLCRLIRTTGVDVPVLLVVTEGGLTVVAADWGIDDVLLNTAGPAEVEARLRLASGRLQAAPETHAADPAMRRPTRPG